jgi:hypothetical protein
MVVLLVSGVILCLAHADGGDGDEMCAGFGPTIGPVTLLPLATLGHADVAPAPPYETVTADLSAPPPEA